MKKDAVPNIGDNNNQPYKYNSKLEKIPSWIKIFFLKYWAAGAAVFFFGMGGSWLGLDYANVDMNDYQSAMATAIIFYILLTLGIALFMTYIVGMIVRYMRSARDNTYLYNMVNIKGPLAFILNLIYAAICMIFVAIFTVIFAQIGVPSIFGSDYGWGLEPFSMGLFYIIVDGFFILVKNGILYLIKRIRYNRDSKI